jgi:hypothetical protein
MRPLQFACYVGLMTLCYVAVGLFLAGAAALVLGHTLIYNLLHLTPTLILIVGATIWGGIGFWIGWSEGRKRYMGGSGPVIGLWR